MSTGDERFARRPLYGIGGNQIFTWRRLMAQSALTAATADEDVVPASDYRAIEAQVRELHRLLREAMGHVATTGGITAT